MSYIDLALAVGFFLFFIAIVVGLSVQYFVEVPTSVSIEEYRETATRMFQQFFGTEGYPSDWEDSTGAPSELGLSTSLYKVYITVVEPGEVARTNETVITQIIFDDECSNIAWNNTLRLYDLNLNEIKYDLVNPIYCSGQYLNESYVRFNANISQSNTSYYTLFYSDDAQIPAPNASVEYCTNSWVGCSGDSWTESTSGWSRHGGVSSSPYANSTAKMHGSYSIEINDGFDSEKLGLIYEPGTAIIGVSNGWYSDFWIYVDDTTGLSSLNVTLSDGTDSIMSNVSISRLTSGEWYHFEKGLAQTEWESWYTFDASNGIQSMAIYLVNSTSDLSKRMKVDELHFERAPLTLDSYPREVEDVISMKKISALNNLTYEQLRDVIGEDYKFRVEIVE